MGYQALYSYWVQQANEQMEARLDKADYAEQELETIVVPLHLPYLTDQTTFERTDGEINLNGITYKYVQRRVWHDSLYLQCLPNYEAMRLTAACNDSFQFATGIPQNGSGFSKVTASLSKQFTGECFGFILPHQIVCTTGKKIFICTSSAIPCGAPSAGPDQPPEFLI